ncbi:unnamed protein product [Ilex paraguariensis]|uniref:Uncharacterized protein n=1 Tax=Ilex paraguariensis TaxID=185542 RepID=A0ABC8RWL5_9AQUA
MEFRKPNFQQQFSVHCMRWEFSHIDIRPSRWLEISNVNQKGNSLAHVYPQLGNFNRRCTTIAGSSHLFSPACGGCCSSNMIPLEEIINRLVTLSGSTVLLFCFLFCFF